MYKKTAILAIVVIIILGGALFFWNYKKRMVSQNTAPTPTASDNVPGQNKADPKTLPGAYEVEGTVENISKKSITVDVSGQKTQLNIVAQTAVDIMSNGKVENGALSDIKTSQTVKIDYSDSTKNANAILIEK